MGRWSLAELIADLEAALVAMPKAVRALLGPGPAQPPEPQVTQFGEYERVEEAKFSPAPPPQALDEGELPESYGRTRLVMLAGGPYQVHAYWEVTPESLSEAEQKIESDSNPYCAVLRFHDAVSANGASAAGWFDVNVDVRARNWYVQLWSADMTYRAELGLRGADGRFAGLAESNLVRTPRAWPRPELEEHFARVEPEQQKPEAVPPPAFVKPSRPRPEPPPPIATVRDEPVALAEEAGGAPADRGAAMQGGAAELLQKKLTELYAHREPPREPPKAEEPPTEPAPAEWIDNPCADLTEMAEEKFLPGISSEPAQRQHAGE